MKQEGNDIIENGRNAHRQQWLLSSSQSLISFLNFVFSAGILTIDILLALSFVFIGFSVYIADWPIDCCLIFYLRSLH